MQRNDLILLKKQIKAEISRREQINQLLKSQEVLKYLKLVEQSTDQLDPKNIREILKMILKHFEVKETNKIYVCTQAYDRDWHAPLVYYCEPDRKCLPDTKHYKDIESQEEVIIDEYRINEFERNHIVLNPYNASYKDKDIRENGYEEARLDFFEACYKSSQSKAFQKVLSKYPKL